MYTTRLKELLVKVVVGNNLSMVEREELLNFVLDFAVNEKENKNTIVFTSHSCNITKSLYDDVCMILKEGKYYDKFAGTFKNNKKIEAIKVIRERLACGLKEAKDVSEDMHFPDYGQYRTC